jgi:hypothetical protein
MEIPDEFHLRTSFWTVRISLVFGNGFPFLKGNIRMNLSGPYCKSNDARKLAYPCDTRQCFISIRGQTALD